MLIFAGCATRNEVKPDWRLEGRPFEAILRSEDILQRSGFGGGAGCFGSHGGNALTEGLALMYIPFVDDTWC